MRRQYVEQRFVTHSLSTGRLSDCGTKELIVGWRERAGGGVVTYQEARMHQAVEFRTTFSLSPQKLL